MANEELSNTYVRAYTQTYVLYVHVCMYVNTYMSLTVRACMYVRMLIYDEHICIICTYVHTYV